MTCNTVIFTFTACFHVDFTCSKFACVHFIFCLYYHSSAPSNLSFADLKKTNTDSFPILCILILVRYPCFLDTLLWTARWRMLLSKPGFSMALFGRTFCSGSHTTRRGGRYNTCTWFASFYCLGLGNSLIFCAGIRMFCSSVDYNRICSF